MLASLQINLWRAPRLPESEDGDPTSAHCQSCRFYDRKLNGATAQGNEGLCRFNPPVNQPDPQGQGLWPVASGHDWYGHYSPEAMAGE